MTDPWDADDPADEERATEAPADDDAHNERLDVKRDRLARLLGVLAALRAAGDAGIRPAEIARRTGMSKRTVYRDLRALDYELRFPVWSEDGRWGVEGGAFLPPLRLTLPEAMAVFLSARLVTRYADKYEPQLASAFQKLEEGLPEALREHVERTLDDLARRRVDPDFNRHVEDLTRAWAERRVVRFRYAPAAYDGAEREPRWAEVRPYLLEPSLATHALYLIGLDETRDALRTFKVERILDLSLTPRTFEAPEAGALEATLRRAWDIIADQPETEVVLRFDQRVARPRPRGHLAPEPGGPRAAGRLAGVAGPGRRHDRDPAVDPVLGRRGRGRRAGRAARRRGGHARARGGPVRRRWSNAGSLTAGNGSTTWSVFLRVGWCTPAPPPCSATPGGRVIERSSLRVPPLRRRLGLAAAAAVVALTVLGVGPARVAAADPQAAMRQDTLDWMNADRSARGLTKYRRWAALDTVAAQRAASMASRDTLSHDAAGGNLGVEYDHSGIQWYGYGEIIGVSNATFGKPSAAMIYKLWKGSAPHAAIMFSSHFNYVGIGFAYRASNNTTWASIVFADSKDHTAPKVARDGRHVARADASRSPGAATTATSRPARPGSRSFDVEVRVDGGPWRLDPEQHPRDVPHRSGTGRAATGTGTGSGAPTGAVTSRRGRARAGSGSRRGRDRLTGRPSGRRLPFAAVNLISDPIHGYVELTKRLSAPEADAAGPPRRGRRRGRPPRHGVGPAAAPDQPAPGRALGLPDRGALAVHPRPRRDARGGAVGALALPEPARVAAARSRPGEPVPSEGLVVETLRIAGLLHDVGHGPFAHFFDEQVLSAFPAPPDPRRRDAKTLTHEDLSQLIIERELGPLIRGLRRAPGAVPDRDRFGDDEAIDPRWVSFLVSKPPLADASMPAWVRVLQPLLSGVFTVDNLDYVRRDAYLTGVSMGPVDAERLRRYTFVSERGLTLYESGVGALEMFLTARLFMYQHVYLHRTVRAIDLDLGEVFAPSIVAVFGDGSPAERLGAFADLDEYALLHQAALWARGERLVGRADRRATGRSRPPSPTAGARSSCDGRAGGPSTRSASSPRHRTGRPPRSPSSAPPSPAASRSTSPASMPDPARAGRRRSRSSGATGPPGQTLEEALGRLPAWLLIGRRFRRIV